MPSASCSGSQKPEKRLRINWVLAMYWFVPMDQPHAVHRKRPADIVSLKLRDSLVRQATGLDHLRSSDTFVIRDPFITSSPAEIRSSVDGHTISPAFAEAMATVIANRVSLRDGLMERSNERQRVSKPSPAQASRIVDFFDNRLDRSISLDIWRNWLAVPNRTSCAVSTQPEERLRIVSL
jgi:hypothetical protein